MNYDGIGKEPVDVDVDLNEGVKDSEIEVQASHESSRPSHHSSNDSISRSNTRRRYDPDDSRNPRLRKPAALAYLQFLKQCQAINEKVSEDTSRRWRKSLQEEADRIQQELKSPKYQMWQLQRSTKHLEEETAKTGKDIVIPTKDLADQEAAITTATEIDREQYLGLLDHHQFLLGQINLLNNDLQSDIPTTAILSIGASFSSGFTNLLDEGASQVEAKTYKDAWEIIHPEMDNLSPTAGWFAAMWGIGILYQKSSEIIAETNAHAHSEPPSDLEIAQKYSQSLIESLKNASFTTSLALLLAPRIENNEEDLKAKSKSLTIEGKILLHTVALALLCKLESPIKPLTSETFLAMLKTPPSMDQKNVKDQHTYWMQQALAALPEEHQSQLLSRIKAYIDTEPALENILDQQKAFSTLLIDNSLNHLALDNSPLGA